MKESQQVTPTFTRPDHGELVPTLHRRILPFNRKNEYQLQKAYSEKIPSLRCLSHISTVDPVTPFDVHTISPHRTVQNGKIGNPPESCQGLSLMPDHELPQEYIIETGIKDDDFQSNVLINGNIVKRYFCYSCPSNLLSDQYKIYLDVPMVHAHIYSPEECSLEAPNEYPANVDSYIYKGFFPKISSMPWKFCCSILDCSKSRYEQYVDDTWIQPTATDKVIGNVYALLTDHHLNSENLRSNDKTRQIIEWMEQNVMQLNVEDLVQFPDHLQWIVLLITEYYLETEEATCGDRAREILNALEQLEYGIPKSIDM